MVLRVSVAPLGHAVADRALWYVQQEKKDLKKSGSLSLQASGEREGGGGRPAGLTAHPLACWWWWCGLMGAGGGGQCG